MYYFIFDSQVSKGTFKGGGRVVGENLLRESEFGEGEGSVEDTSEEEQVVEPREERWLLARLEADGCWAAAIFYDLFLGIVWAGWRGAIRQVITNIRQQAVNLILFRLGTVSNKIRACLPLSEYLWQFEVSGMNTLLNKMMAFEPTNFSTVAHKSWNKMI